VQLDAGMARLDRRNQVDDLVGRDGAHDAELQGRFLEPTELGRQTLGGDRPLVHRREMRMKHAAQFAQVAIPALSME
jgi:hypothetical protein